MSLTRITQSAINTDVIDSTRLQNAAIQERHFQGGVIAAVGVTSGLATQLDVINTNANVATVIANVSTVQTNVNTVQSNVNSTQANVELVSANHIAFATYANTNLDTKSNVSATYIQLNSNLNTTSTNVGAVIANATAFGTYANTNLDTKANVSATLFSAYANDYVTWNLLDANISTVQDNVTAITDGATEFTTNKIFQQNVVVQGNLIVVGSQVDLGVGTATIDDNFIVVSANLTGAPATDSGIIVNRGTKGNVFIGDHIVEDGIVFALSQSPHDNATISIQEYLDVHGNAFHANSGLNFNRVHFGHHDDESTGIIADTTNNHIKFIIGGTEVANLAADANLVLNDGKITGSPNASGERNSIDMDVDEEPSVVNSVGIFSVNSIFMGLDTNNNGDSTYFGIFNDTDDLSTATRDTATFSVRDYGEVFVSDDISIEGNANILLDAVVTNAVIGTRVFEGTVGLQANDSATYFAAYANDYVTYTRLNANVNAVQSNLSTAHTDLSSNINSVQNNVAAITGGGTFLSPFVNTNSATGTSNVFFIGKDTASYSNIITVTLDGVFQANTEYVANFANDTIQFTDATIPSGTIVTIFSMT